MAPRWHLVDAVGAVEEDILAIAEALGHQINNNGNGKNGAQGPMTLATFLKVNPPKFKETTNPTEADTWFQAMERALQAQLVPEEQCVEFATYLLTGEASHWWQGAQCLLQQDDDPITWDAFQVEFYKKYFLNSARTAKKLELLQLRFFCMCQGAPGDFEEWKCIKYERGLQSDILSSVGPMEIKIFLELVNKSRVAEEYVKKAAAEKRSLRGPFPHNRWKSFAPRGPPFKRGVFVPNQNQGQNNSRRLNNNNF
ncbi:uncharacterized protein LOC107494211 [Arachis duranensis]|uniref:Uncharacterized protein LOC107494211 n=1 Tax=Arachis duranensis TaxID=130453 RepID=A0A6P4DXL5_ARADU|nr:uncharacterized protein LOC107494211 [Arachis duranensis]